MDYVTPQELIAETLRAAQRKSQLSVRDMLLRGALAGAFLGFATSLVFVVQSQGLPPIAGALLFPVGFVILVLLGGVVLLVGATAADSLSLFWVILWTVTSFVLIFGGLRGILRRD